MPVTTPKRGHQIVAAIGTTFGAFALGNVLGWPSPALRMLLVRLGVSQLTELSLITSIALLGAALGPLIAFFTIDRLGRKLSMLLTTLPFMLAWLLILLGKTIPILCVGRFITGICGGVFCVAAPTYISEISDKHIRGRLVVLLQLMLCAGILFAYIIGEFGDYFVLTVPLLLMPVGYFIVICFLPESPVFLLAKNKPEKAKSSLQFYRGHDYDISEEMNMLEDYNKRPDEKFWPRFLTKPCIRAFSSIIALHVIQQFSGIKTVVIFARPIFEMVGSNVGPGVNAIIVGLMLVIFTVVSMLVVDIAGRKLLMLVSLAIQVLSLFMIGIFFTLQKQDAEKAKEFAWMPLIFCCLYIAGYSLGSGPIPWVVQGELLPNSIKPYCAPVCASSNYLWAFCITVTFPYVSVWFGIDIVFYVYSGICVCGAIFVSLVLIETKGKTLDEIQIALGAKTN